MSNNGWIDQKYVVHIYNGIITRPLKRIMPSAATCMDLEIIILSTSVQFSCSAVFNSLQPCGLQHDRPPCPSPTPGVDSNSCPLSQWCHPTISTPVVPFSSSLQSFPASGSFPMSQFFESGGQSIRVSASTPRTDSP